MKVTYYGHSCFLLEAGGSKILFDPFISPNELAAAIDVKAIQADYILLSHGHEDHMADLVPIASRTGAKVVTSFEGMGWLGKQGISNCHPMNIGGNWKFDFGSVQMVYACHSNVFPDGTYGGLAAGFIIRTEGKVIYYAGDTALFGDMKLIGELNKPDYAFLPIGDNFTMGIDDAIRAAGFVGCKEIIGMHYNTFGYIKIDEEQALGKFSREGLGLHLIEIGSSMDLQ